MFQTSPPIFFIIVPVAVTIVALDSLEKIFLSVSSHCHGVAYVLGRKQCNQHETWKYPFFKRKSCSQAQVDVWLAASIIKQRLEEPAQYCDHGNQVWFSSARPYSGYRGLVMSQSCLWPYGTFSRVGRTVGSHPESFSAFIAQWPWSSDLLRFRIR